MKCTLLIRALHRVRRLPERVHPDGHREDEGGQQERAEIGQGPKATSSPPPSAITPDAGTSSSGAGTLLARGVGNSLAPLEQVGRRPRDDGDRGEENPPDQQSHVMASS